MTDDDIRRTIAVVAWVYENKKTSVNGCSGKESGSLSGTRSGDTLRYRDKNGDTVVVQDIHIPCYIDFGVYTRVIRIDEYNGSRGSATAQGKQFRFTVSGDRVSFDSGEEYSLY